MCATEKTIKVVKRKEREIDSTQEADDLDLVKTERQMQREMVQTVASWIVERREVKKTSYKKDLMISTICKISTKAKS